MHACLGTGVFFLGVTLGMSSGISQTFLLILAVLDLMKRHHQMGRDRTVHEESERFLPASVSWENVCMLDDSEQQTTFSFSLSQKTLSAGCDAACRDHLGAAQREVGSFQSGIFIHFVLLKKVSHLPSLLGQVCGVENKGNLKECYGASTQQESCWCAAEEGDGVSWLTGLTLLWRMFHFQAHSYTEQ